MNTEASYMPPYATILPFSPEVSCAGNAFASMTYAAIVAGAGQVPFTFSMAPGSGPGGACLVGLVANGISAAPDFSAFVTGGAWNNSVGILNSLTFSLDDDMTPCCYISGAVIGTIPTPTSFVAVLNGTTISIGYSAWSAANAGLAAVTPPLTAFSLNITRSSDVPLPVLSSVSAVEAGATAITLNVSGGEFLAGDIVELSYWQTALQPGTNGRIALIQDQTSPLSTKLPGWAGAIATVQ